QHPAMAYRAINKIINSLVDYRKTGKNRQHGQQNPPLICQERFRLLAKIVTFSARILSCYVGWQQ
ncbi:MAG: hypothetical protein KAI07_06895, partial [Deltaproteobacteria bacterium]|nr:hypothetical protein [Deltaproteobacteria bacterium]